MSIRATLFFLALACLAGATPAAAVMCTPRRRARRDPFAALFRGRRRARGQHPFSLNNSRATAALAHVTLWTDWSQPTAEFNVYLTGYDVVTINLRDVISGGNIPITADDGSDPTDSDQPARGVFPGPHLQQLQPFLSLLHQPGAAGPALRTGFLRPPRPAPPLPRRPLHGRPSRRRHRPRLHHHRFGFPLQYRDRQRSRLFRRRRNRHRQRSEHLVGRLLHRRRLAGHRLRRAAGSDRGGSRLRRRLDRHRVHLLRPLHRGPVRRRQPRAAGHHLGLAGAARLRPFRADRLARLDLERHPDQRILVRPRAGLATAQRDRGLLLRRAGKRHRALPVERRPAGFAAPGYRRTAPASRTKPAATGSTLGDLAVPANFGWLYLDLNLPVDSPSGTPTSAPRASSPRATSPRSRLRGACRWVSIPSS